MAQCDTCVNNCCVRPCVAELLCALDCCGCCHIPVLLAPNQDLKAGTILGQRSSDLRFVPFNPEATDGSEQPRGILHYHVITDADGRVTGRYFGMLGLGLDCGPLYTNMYICGIFRTQDLDGDLNAAIATGQFGRIVQGTEDSGLFKF